MTGMLQSVIVIAMKNIETITKIANEFAKVDCVESIAIGGSLSSGMDDADSDVDMYIYSVDTFPAGHRKAIAEKFAAPGALQVCNSIWEPGDEWTDSESGVAFDIMFRTTDWINEKIDSVLVRHSPSLGFTTCFVYNVLRSECIFDRSEFYAGLRKRTDIPYPPELSQAIIKHNRFVLRVLQSNYIHQLELAVKRGDSFSVLHRTDEFFKSVYDIIFAINRAWHPGEKRIAAHIRNLCPKLPENFDELTQSLIASVGENGNNTVESAVKLLDSLDKLLLSEGYEL